MKLKHTFEMMELDDQIVAIPLGDGAADYHGVVKMNETGAFIFGLLKEDVTEEDILGAVSKEFALPQDEIADSVKEYIAGFRDKGFLEE